MYTQISRKLGEGGGVPGVYKVPKVAHVHF